MAVTRVVWRDAALHAWYEGEPRTALRLLASLAAAEMKAHIPVSPVYPVYAYPVTPGFSKGTTYQVPGAFGRGLALPKGPAVSRARYAGDLPLRPSGFLRNSVVIEPIPLPLWAGGGYLIGPTANYGKWVNNGTPPHIIRSTGPWPLRNRATGQIFGPLVHHPGTKGAHFVEATVASLRGKVFRFG
jgi:hypothetical protein